MRISDWSSDVCSSDLPGPVVARRQHRRDGDRTDGLRRKCARLSLQPRVPAGPDRHADARAQGRMTMAAGLSIFDISGRAMSAQLVRRSEEHTSELQSLMRNSYAVFCL